MVARCHVARRWRRAVRPSNGLDDDACPSPVAVAVTVDAFDAGISVVCALSAVVVGAVAALSSLVVRCTKGLRLS